jgi:hypothetical protein
MESSKYTGLFISIPIPAKLLSCCGRYATVNRGKQLILHSNSLSFFLYQVWPECRCAFSLETLFDRSISVCCRRAQRTVRFLRFELQIRLKVPTQNFRNETLMQFRNINLLYQGYFRVKRNSEVCHVICNYHFLFQPMPKLLFSL